MHDSPVWVIAAITGRRSRPVEQIPGRFQELNARRPGWSAIDLALRRGLDLVFRVNPPAKRSSWLGWGPSGALSTVEHGQSR